MNIIRILLLTSSLALIENVSGKEKNCKATVSSVLKFQMKQINVCSKKLGLKGREKVKKMNCVMKCVLISTGSLREDGTLSVADGLKFILREFSMSALEKAVIKITRCQEFATELDPKEENCNSYSKFVKCLTNFIMTVCN